MADPTLEDMIAFVKLLVESWKHNVAISSAPNEHRPRLNIWLHILRTLEAQRWRDIAEAPNKPCAVEFFFGDWPNTDLAPRDERRVIGFFEGLSFRENGTGHNIADRSGGTYGPPTHWRPLPEPPSDG